MAESWICLDIHAEVIVAVVVEHGGGMAVVKGCAQANTRSQTFAAAIKQIQQDLGSPKGKWRITIGAELISFRTVTLPFSEKKKIGQVLPLEIADLIPVAVESLLLDSVVTSSGPQGAEILVAMIARDYLADRLAVLRTAQIDPTAIGISGIHVARHLGGEKKEDFIVFDVGDCWATLFLLRQGRVALVRSLGAVLFRENGSVPDIPPDLFVRETMLASRFLASHQKAPVCYLLGQKSSKEQELLADLQVPVKRYELSKQPAIRIDPSIKTRYRPETMDRAVAIALDSGKKFDDFDFCKEEFKTRRSLREHFRSILAVGVPVLVLLLGLVLYYASEYRQMVVENDDLRQKIAAVFKETVPEVTRIVNPVQQLQVLIKEKKSVIKPAGAGADKPSVVNLLAELSLRINASYAVKVDRLVIDSEGVRVKAITDGFKTVDSIQKELGRSPFFKEVIISSANQAPQGNSVNFELKLVLGGE